MQAGILFWDCCCVFTFPKAFLIDIKAPMLLLDALFPPGNQTSSSEPPAETSRQTNTSYNQNKCRVSQVIYVPGELKSPYGGCLGDKADLANRDVILAPTAGGKQFSRVCAAVTPKGLRSETPYKHVVTDRLLSLLPRTGNTQKRRGSQRGEVAFPSQSQPAEGPRYKSPSGEWRTIEGKPAAQCNAGYSTPAQP